MQSSTESKTYTGAQYRVTKTVMNLDVQCTEFYLAIHTFPSTIVSRCYELACLFIQLATIIAQSKRAKKQLTRVKHIIP